MGLGKVLYLVGVICLVLSGVVLSLVQVRKMKKYGFGFIAKNVDKTDKRILIVAGGLFLISFLFFFISGFY